MESNTWDEVYYKGVATPEVGSTFLNPASWLFGARPQAMAMLSSAAQQHQKD